MAAIIDWYSKAILAHKISNTMDASLVIDVLNDALEKYGVPEIFCNVLNYMALIIGFCPRLYA